MAESKYKPHAIMISVPYQGHINPFASLALKLASSGFSVTFVHYEFLHQKLPKLDLFSEARESGLDIRYTTIKDGFPSEFDRGLHLEEHWESISLDRSGTIDEFVGKTIQSDPDSVHFLIADTITAWPVVLSNSELRFLAPFLITNWRNLSSSECYVRQGHINPFVGLALKLASNGFSITFVHLEFIHHKLSKAHHKNPEEFDLFSEARESGLDIRYTTMSDGFPLEFDRDLHIMEYWESLLRDFPTIVEEFVGKIIRSDQVSVYFLVADTNYFWPATIAKKYNLVNVSLWTEPALVFSLIYHLDLLREKGHFPCKGMYLLLLAGVGKISTRDLMPYLKEAVVLSNSVLLLLAPFLSQTGIICLALNATYACCLVKF